MGKVLNSISLLGYISTNPAPELQQVNNSGYVLRFSLMVTEIVGSARIVQWHNICAMDELAQMIHRDATPGQEIALTGRLTYRKVGTMNGSAQYVPEIVVEDFALLSRVKEPQDPEHTNISRLDLIYHIESLFPPDSRFQTTAKTGLELFESVVGLYADPANWRDLPHGDLCRLLAANLVADDQRSCRIRP